MKDLQCSETYQVLNTDTYSVISSNISLPCKEKLKVIGLLVNAKVDKSICNDLKATILAKMDADKVPLQFERFQLVENSWIEINCIDETTRDWLLDLEEIEITISKNHSKTTVQFYRITKYYTLTVDIPWFDSNFELFKHRLCIQNPGINTSLWRFVKEKCYRNAFQEDVKKFLFEVDQESFRFIESRNWLLYFQFGNITFQTFDIKCCLLEDNADEVPQSVLITFFTRQDLKNSVFLKDIIKTIVRKNRKKCVTFSV